jgi:TorA maturation chaperone TorD
VKLLFEDELQEQTEAAIQLLSDHLPDDLELGPGERDPSEWTSETLSDLFDVSRSSLREQYMDVFGHTISKDCPPYELEYLDRTDLFYRSRQLSDISGFYRAFGLGKSDDHHYRADHLCLQTEYLAFLIAKRLHGQAEGHDREDLDTCLDAEETFYDDHLSWWLPSFAKALRDTAGRDTFYGTLGTFLGGLSVLERNHFDREPETDLHEPRVMEYDPEDQECGSCDIPAMTAQSEKTATS